MKWLTEEIYALLKEWCDGLIRYQITEIADRNLKGGLLCPACSIIHGRCGNAIPAMLFLAEREKNERYLHAAEGLIEWSEQLICPDGGILNDTESDWKGITAFAYLAHSEGYFRYGHLLSKPYAEKLHQQVGRMLSYLSERFDIHSGNINYLIATAYCLEKAGKDYHNADYSRRAAEIYREFSRYFTENGLIFGEGSHSWNEVSKKGCRPIDIGYSVEEMLNHLVLYALSSGNPTAMELAQKSAEAYFQFFLPDGGIDNSMGTRMDKWTYWGSRTSDGCQPAFFILGKHDPHLALAAYRNMQLLKDCTHDGLLYGGRDLFTKGEPPCLHHAFCHVNGLLTALEWLKKNEIPDFRAAVFPEEGKYFPELDCHIIRRHGFRATLTAYDCLTQKEACTPRGGALSLLYHEKAGMICAASMTRYKRYELQNTQRYREDTDTPLTPMLVYRSGEKVFSSVQDRNAEITKIDEDTYLCEGSICNEDAERPFDDDIRYSVLYRFLHDELCMVYTYHDEKKRLDFHFPVVAVDAVDIEIEAAQKPQVQTVFNHVPGFTANDFYIKSAPQEITVHLKIR